MADPARTIALDGSRAMRGHAHRRGDEAIPAARYGLDVARLLRVVAERRPDFADRRLEHRFGDEPMSPDGVEQGVLGHEPARGARERAQHGERFRRERYGLAGARESCVGFVELEPLEAQPREGWIRLHARAPSSAPGSG